MLVYGIIICSCIVSMMHLSNFYSTSSWNAYINIARSFERKCEYEYRAILRNRLKWGEAENFSGKKEAWLPTYVPTWSTIVPTYLAQAYP